MADKLDPTEEKLSLSMPSLRRKRRKRSPARSETPADAPSEQAPVAEAAPAADPPRDSGAEDTAVLREVPAAQPVQPVQPEQPEQPEQPAEDTTDTVGSSTGLASGPIPGAPSPPVAAARPHHEDTPSAADQPAGAEGDEGDDDAESAPWRERVDLIPMLPGRIAALVTGAVVGLAGTALTYAGLQGCSSVRGTSTCGAPGFILLFAILVILVLLGSVLLNVWQIEGAGSASVLGVGLTTVLMILFFTSVIFSPWMFLLVPVVGALAFLGSRWVTTHFTDEPVDAWR